MNPLLANKLNRPDLAASFSFLATSNGVGPDPYGGTSGMVQGPNLAASVDGRVTAGVLIVALFVVAGFYVWTRGVQA